MIRVCAWCSRSLENPDEIINAETVREDVTHGICLSCSLEFMDDETQDLEAYLDSLPVPLMTVGPDSRIDYINSRACHEFNLEPQRSRGQLGGDVLRCAFARLPGGCGHTIHCLACTVRKTVEDTFRTGTPHLNVPASLEHSRQGGPRQVDYYISTYRAGNHVVLRIHDARPLETPLPVPADQAS